MDRSIYLHHIVEPSNKENENKSNGIESGRVVDVATSTGAATIAGGGDTAAAVTALGLEKGFSHISTGGGASLQMLEGRPLASLEVLDTA